MKTSELTRKLSKAGCYLAQHGKRHNIWYSPITDKYEEVPRHTTQEVAKGTLGKILKNLLGE